MDREKKIQTDRQKNRRNISANRQTSLQTKSQEKGEGQDYRETLQTRHRKE